MGACKRYQQLTIVAETTNLAQTGLFVAKKVTLQEVSGKIPEDNIILIQLITNRCTGKTKDSLQGVIDVL